MQQRLASATRADVASGQVILRAEDIRRARPSFLLLGAEAGLQHRIPCHLAHVDPSEAVDLPHNAVPSDGVLPSSFLKNLLPSRISCAAMDLRGPLSVEESNFVLKNDLK